MSEYDLMKKVLVNPANVYARGIWNEAIKRAIKIVEEWKDETVPNRLRELLVQEQFELSETKTMWYCPRCDKYHDKNYICERILG